ncbi:MAG: fumarylacetoacetate hydrolase family protein [Crocinitomicaceae bacterium]|nr:fumarylacetoacetate hydrolase family protein [Crocinitomicaceae bacterium]MDP4683867.1 fumarylacetoacetate hydrolase family protein [Crocinitomicaceae bacterium]MDP4865842.1 fumarylacetoacetate hydrolase family protein [Crocinitomicaceae bacterium]
MKIICIGRNYAEHAKEMNSDVPTEPVFFMKPDTSILKNGSDFYYPDFTKDLHHECELVIKIDKNGKNIAEKFADKYYSSMSLGIDFTARDLQAECKSKGLPWEKAKSFEHSAPISTEWLLTDKLSDAKFSLAKNGELVQSGSVSDMIFNINQIISYVSRYMTLKTGDLIYTGTPSGVGPVVIGDKLEGFLNGQKMFEFDIK